jgi:hypothetical protein
MGRRKADNPIDWELIEKEYRLGQFTLRQLAATHGVQASAISRRSKKEGWVQDKSAQVKALSENQLLVSNTREATAKATPTKEDIEVAATTRTNVILNNRRDISRAMRITNSMFDELESAEEKKAPLAKRAPIAKQLTEALRIQVGLERQAFGIIGEEGEQPEHLVNALATASAAASKTFSDAERAIRLARMLQAVPVPAE